MASPRADVSCRLLETDFAAIEAKLTGWCMRHPEFIRLAGLGVHGALASHLLGDPYDPAAPDAELSAKFKAIKHDHFAIYDRSKRTVYGDLYGQTEYGMVKTHPAYFPTLKVASQYKRVLRQMVPELPAWHNGIRERAYRQNYLGGAGDHPFAYKHWFWDVIGYRGIPESAYRKREKLHEPVARIQGRPYAVVLGADAKRAVAFYPQSIAAGVLKEALLRLFDPELPCYIGDAYFGRTPLRAPIHDSGLWEIPNRVWDRVLEAIVGEMVRAVPELPLDWMSAADKTRLRLGDYLSIGVAAKGGRDWGHMEEIELPEGAGTALGAEDVGEVKEPVEAGETEEEWMSLRTTWQAAAGAA